MLFRTIALIGLLLGAPMPALAGVYVLGDSIGEGVGEVSGQKNLARVSVSIRNRWVYRQFPQVPQGSIVFLVLGTNDADWYLTGLDKRIDEIIQTAEAAKLRMYWLGPVCLFTKSEPRSVALDQILAEKLKNTSITYISMREPELCERDMRVRDGVHLKSRGYFAMWSKAAGVAGIEVARRTPVASKGQCRRGQLGLDCPAPLPPRRPS